MKTSLPLFLVAAASVIASAGCAGAADPGEAVGSAQQAAGPSLQNGLEPRIVWDFGTQRAIQALGNAPLSQIPSLPSLQDAWRLTLLSHMIECALTSDQWTQDTYQSPGPNPIYTPTVYLGWEGLAPRWLNAPLDADGRRWVTACLAQRLNYFGQQVTILLEGNNPPIYFNTNLDSQFPFEESTAWGDWFSTPPTQHATIDVCYDTGFASYCPRGGDPTQWLRSRICDNVLTWSDQSGGLTGICGLNIVGPCATACTTSTTGYPLCQVTPSSPWDDHTVHVQLTPPNRCFF